MRLVAIVLAEVVSVLTLLLIAGHGPWAGRTVIRLDSDHGINTGDLPLLVLWAVAMWACVWLWREGKP